ncbi:hypothetical protein JY452_07090 [Stenotrophomonas maltophilia]|uniref:hypothetical protein n=1 Tax=Stenotrophomonas maltophilia TaxID=40324 RepID=UPI0013DD321A|nr:hypothetical protein [Stenotrophomonas maltophilia]MBH1886908.1 hypothetical protein [Stenotrophomonas maltophilia]MBN5083737.1 hypothetical protein [Stenotrophomonas maltophilia]MBN5100443.1 hypothetical protein [Stenotrophomonas maltophilia]MBN5125757.1 hypothetical protein [Stenotrophomonas maltophilia]
MCVVTIGYQEFLLPAANGLKIMQLMTGALQVDARYDDGRIYELRDEPVQVEYTSVDPRQVRARRPREESARGPLAIEGRATRLLGGPKG